MLDGRLVISAAVRTHVRFAASRNTSCWLAVAEHDSFDRREPGLLAQVSNDVLVCAENGQQPPGEEPHRVTVGSLDAEAF